MTQICAYIVIMKNNDLIHCRCRYFTNTKAPKKNRLSQANRLMIVTTDGALNTLQSLSLVHTCATRHDTTACDTTGQRTKARRFFSLVPHIPRHDHATRF